MCVIHHTDQHRRRRIRYSEVSVVCSVVQYSLFAVGLTGLCFHALGTHYVRIRDKNVQVGRDYCVCMCAPTGIGHYESSAAPNPCKCETGLCGRTIKEVRKDIMMMMMIRFHLMM